MANEVHHGQQVAGHAHGHLRQVAGDEAEDDLHREEGDETV
jgi:hypothetical protein